MGSVLLGEKDFEPWLSGSAGLELLQPSKRVTSSREVLRRVAGSGQTYVDEDELLRAESGVA